MHYFKSKVFKNIKTILNLKVHASSYVKIKLASHEKRKKKVRVYLPDLNAKKT